MTNFFEFLTFWTGNILKAEIAEEKKGWQNRNDRVLKLLQFQTKRKDESNIATKNKGLKMIGFNPTQIHNFGSQIVFGQYYN